MNKPHRSHIAKNSGLNYLSKIIPAVLSLVYTILLTNYLSADLYGVYNYLPVILTGFFTLFGGSFLNNIIWVFTARTKTKDVFKKIFFIEVAILVLMIISIILFGKMVLTYFGIGYQDYLFVASLFLIVTPINTMFITFFKGFSRFGKILYAAIIENVLTLTLIFAVIYLNLGLWGAFFGKAIALTASIAYLAYHYKKTHVINNPIKFKEIKEYGKWNLISNFLRESSNQIQLIGMGIFLNAATLGLYYLGEKISKIILSNFSMSISETVYSKNSENYLDKKKIELHTSTAVKYGFIINIILGVGIIVLAPLLVSILFPKYMGVLPFLWMFVVYEIIQSQNPVSGIFDSINKTKTNVRLSGLVLATILFITLPLTYLFNIWGVLAGIIITAELKYIYTLHLLKLEGINIGIIPQKRDFLSLLRIVKSKVFSYLNTIKNRA